MTDKQIIENKNGFYCIEPCSEIKQLKEQLQAKEQECEELKRQLETKGKILTLIDEAKNEYLKENNKLKQTLAEIKKLVEKEFCRHIECCEFCANSNDCLNRKIINKINEVENE
jgi:sugar-specific transcriptional regulator TrmB